MDVDLHRVVDIRDLLIGGLDHMLPLHAKSPEDKCLQDFFCYTIYLAFRDIFTYLKYLFTFILQAAFSFSGYLALPAFHQSG